MRRPPISLSFGAVRAFFSFIKTGVSLIRGKDTVATSSFIGFISLSRSLEYFTDTLKGDKLAVKLVI